MSITQPAQHQLGHGQSIEFDDNPAVHRHAVRAIAEWMGEDGGIESRRAEITHVYYNNDSGTTYVQLQLVDNDGCVAESCLSTYDVRKALASFDLHGDVISGRGDKVSIHISGDGDE